MVNKLLSFHLYPYYVKKFLGKYIFPRAMVRAGVKVGARIQLYGMPIVSMSGGSEIVIGGDCVLCSRSDMTDLGVNHPIILRTLRSGACIAIGDHTGISGGSICAATRIEIGSECLLGANVTISDTDFHPVTPVGRRYNIDWKDIAAAPVIIEDNVFIGTGAVILKGVRIGKNSVIGAGAVVTKSIPANSIAAGNPAKVIRSVC